MKTVAGFDGSGSKVAILDTGVRGDHPGLTGRVVAEACFCTNCCPNGQSVQIGPGSAVDIGTFAGHGTLVAGIAAGAGGQPEVPEGAAPGASIVAVRVINPATFLFVSADVVDAIDWLVDNHSDAVAANLSLATFEPFAGNCDSATTFTILMSAAISSLKSGGTLVVASSGNDASDSGMGAPACIESTFSVAAVWDDNVGVGNPFAVCTDLTTAIDKVTCFSNLSATTDLLAPGARVTSAGLPPSNVATSSGTSFAAPMVVGCAALLQQANFGALPPTLIESAMRDSPDRFTRPPLSMDYPRLNCLNALVKTDIVQPTINITNPTTGTSFQSLTSTITLAGNAGDNLPTDFLQITWSNDRGGSGTASGTSNWSTGPISLQTGLNVITVMARDIASNTAVDQLNVVFGTATIAVDGACESPLSFSTTVPALAINATTGNTAAETVFGFSCPSATLKSSKSELSGNMRLTLNGSDPIALDNSSVIGLYTPAQATQRRIRARLAQPVLCTSFSTFTTDVGIELVNPQEPAGPLIYPSLRGLSSIQYFVNDGEGRGLLRISSSGTSSAGNLACCVLSPAVNALCLQGDLLQSSTGGNDLFSDGFEEFIPPSGPDLVVSIQAPPTASPASVL
ncbi:MAG: S8/S53 family peptidase, partial [Xanthomonadales bacterium]|nr:S8/S53 family peptidase [Xanthomonadales bacterium]